MRTHPIVVRHFTASDQENARNLILSGLVEHWGWLDSSKNTDLDDIGKSYATGTFLVAYSGETLVGTGALLPRGEGIAEIVRMSVIQMMRRQGVGSIILAKLIAIARSWDCQRIILETTSTWDDAVAFYRNHGFRVTKEHAGDTYFILDL